MSPLFQGGGQWNCVASVSKVIIWRMIRISVTENISISEDELEEKFVRAIVTGSWERPRAIARCGARRNASTN